MKDVLKTEIKFRDIKKYNLTGTIEFPTEISMGNIFDEVYTPCIRRGRKTVKIVYKGVLRDISPIAIIHFSSNIARDIFLSYIKEFDNDEIRKFLYIYFLRSLSAKISQYEHIKKELKEEMKKWMKKKARDNKGRGENDEDTGYMIDEISERHIGYFSLGW